MKLLGRIGTNRYSHKARLAEVLFQDQHHPIHILVVETNIMVMDMGMDMVMVGHLTLLAIAIVEDQVTGVDKLGTTEETIGIKEQAQRQGKDTTPTLYK